MENTQISQQPSTSGIPPFQAVPPVNNKKKYLTILCIVLLMLFIGESAYYLGANTNKTAVPEKTKEKEQIATTPTEPAPISPTTIVTSAPDAIPLKNTLYLGMYEGKYAIFFTNNQKQKYYDEGGVEKTSPYVGELKTADGRGINPFDYKKLTDPKKINLINTNPVFSVESFMLSKENTKLYLSINFEEQTSQQYPENLINRIYQITISPFSSKDIWSNEIGSNKYTGKGTTYITQTAGDKYIVMSLGGCYACGGHTPKEAIVVNIDSKNEKYLPDAGDIQINEKEKTFTYKKYAEFKEPCEPGMGCDDGQRTVLKPSGQAYTETLP